MITDQERQSERVRVRERETTTNKGGDASETVPLVFQSVSQLLKDARVCVYLPL